MVTALKYLLTWAAIMLVALLFAAIMNQQINPLKWEKGSLIYLAILGIVLLVSAIVGIRKAIHN